ncbi:XrtA/PEP-CTERM system TPR-repeat protein PrsT [Alteromonas sp. CYL-A6]|uniref:XrtA/PEP-CTERM system TPR-repeat protein PrsT n=1 Tax=Alteromonas nitratireducens TaxID=3390813 RepID=UPI0034B4ABAE
MDKNKRHTFKQVAVAVAISGALLTGGCSKKSVDDYIAEAQTLVSQGDADAAIIAYKNAIQQNPKAPQPRFELGRLYLEQQNYDSAEKELTKAKELGYSAADVLPLLALAYQQTGAENALADVDHTVQGMTSVQRAEVGFYKVQALLELDKKDQALALIEELLTLDTDSVYLGLLEVYRDILNEDVDGALIKAEALRDRAPLNKDVLMQLARLYLTTGNRDGAIDVYKDYVSSYPKDVASQFALISMLVENRRLDEARPYVDRLLERSDDHPLLNQFRGIIAAADKDYQLALQRLEKAIQNGNNDPAVRLVAGYSAYQLQDFASARKHLSMVASRLPDNHPGLRMLADSLLQEGKSDDAFSVLNRLEGDLDSDADLFTQAGLQLLRKGNIVDAQTMVEKTEPLSETPEQLARLGVLQLSLNDIDGLVNLEAAAKKAPESVATQSTLIRAYLAAGEIEKAKEVATDWRNAQPEALEPVLSLANIAITTGDYDTAEQLIDDAAALDADAGTVRYARIRLASATGDNDKALSLVKAQLTQSPADITAIVMWYSLAAQQQGATEVLNHAMAEVQKAPDNLPLRLLAARLHFAEQQTEKGLSLLEPVEPDETTPVAYWSMRGQALINTNNAKAADEHYQRWTALYPQNVDAVKGMLLIMDAQGRYQDGLDLVTQTLSKRPDGQLLVLQAYFNARAGNVRAARDILAPLPESILSLPFVQGIEARLLLQEQKPDQAIAHALAAYEGRSNSQNAILVLAAYEMAGKAQQGFDFISQHVEQHPDDTRSAMLLAERVIGRDQGQAISMYEAIIKRTPDSFVALNNLAYLYTEAGNLDRAATLAARAVEMQPKNADAVDTLAQIRIRQGRKDDAMELYTAVANQEIPNEEVYLNHVALLLDMGETTLAKRRLREREFTRPASLERVQALKSQYGL